MNTQVGRRAARGAGRRAARGAVAVEFVLLIPVLLTLIGLVVAGSKVWWVKTGTAQLASSAARQASIARSASEAVISAGQVVQSDAVHSGLRCGAEGIWPTLTLDTSGFHVAVGLPAQVTATVRCSVPLSDLILPGLPGYLPVEATAVSPLDRFRARE